MNSETESNSSKRTRVPKKPATALNMDRASSSSASGSAPPTPAASFVTGDPLADQEFAAFGLEAEEAPLPAPPKNAKTEALAAQAAQENGAAALAAGAVAAGGPRTTLRAAAITGPIGRAKRPKNVKFSPAKTGKALARRAANGKGSGDGEVSLPNNDFCDACHGKGHFLCCDGGCLRSFHFTCLEPPLELDDLGDEAWFCKACRAVRNPPAKPPRGFFRELIYKVECENPKAFQLSAEIKSLYKNVTTAPNGDYIDSNEHRPPSKITGRAIGQEDRDGYRVKDKTGRAIVCYNCSETASQAKQRRIISCDFCEQHWHLDCLDPPMTGMPPPTRKWMCPLHSDHILPKKRLPKTTNVVVVNEPRVANNGDIIVVPRQPVRALDDDRYEEMTVSRIRYQVPEDTVILDFWGRLTGAPKSARAPQVAKLVRSGSPDSVGSPLTSMGEVSDADPPEVAKLGYSPYSKRNADLYGRRTPASGVDTSALDHLALLAENAYAELNGSGPSDTPTPATGPSPPGGVVGSDKGKGVDRRPSFGSSGGPPPAKRARQSLAPGAAPIDQSSVSPATSSNAPLAIPPYRAGAVDPSAPLARPHPPAREPSKHSSQTPSEVSVKSKEDLKALMHVRKLLASMDEAGMSAETFAEKKALMTFMDGGAVVPKLAFFKKEDHRQPWDLPWEEQSKSERSKPAGAGESHPQAPKPASSEKSSSERSKPTSSGEEGEARSFEPETYNSR
ncbi:hypothetical protein BCR35DRAFT_309871 [Leucosporidium creatinivorum]|uniref:PHD-type domain-containing protein n=1 Tax=Leucosporidium creatinivorum TaxID=106004 RepID=A0A1Y2DB12_9BASI|nr:hypothetical protein BCR35DRAFT_309871 [Leucosporidium creatinivorum]